jgi:DNA-binding HxlR family transcriptional regulator
VKEMNINKIIEEGIGNKLNIRIIKALANVELSKYSIEKKTGIRSRNLNKKLKKLKDLKIINEYKYNGIKKYSLNYKNNIIKKFLDFLIEVKYIE